MDAKTFLAHWGIPGMKWGRRKGNTSSSSSPAKDSQNSADHDKAAAIKKKKLSEMSNDELRTLATRLQLEKQLRDLTPAQKSLGKKLASDAIQNLATKTLTGITDIGAKMLSDKAGEIMADIVGKKIAK